MWDKNSLTSESGSRLVIYRSLKFSPRTGNYLVEVLNPGQRTMVQFWAGCLPLELETARYWSPRIPVSERVCKLCTLDEVENEFHFVMECPRLSEPRTLFPPQKADISVNVLQLNPKDNILCPVMLIVHSYVNNLLNVHA